METVGMNELMPHVHATVCKAKAASAVKQDKADEPNNTWGAVSGGFVVRFIQASTYDGDEQCNEDEHDDCHKRVAKSLSAGT